jgi:hypothetical protein
MAKFYTELDNTLTTFIAQQKMFFIATAPTEGRINLSPKGLDSLLVLDNNTVAFLNITGSGNETAAHLFENGRMTMMFCSYSEKPLILRLYGQGRAIHPRDEEWSTLYPQFKSFPGARQIIVLTIESAQTSCGFGVPMYEFSGDRDALITYHEKQGPDGVKAYQQKHNQVSIDGLPTHLIPD